MSEYRASSVRLPVSLANWLNEQAASQCRSVVEQFNYTISLALEEWEGLRRRAADNPLPIREEEEASVSTRLPYPLFEEIHQLALAEQRTVSKQLVFMLQQARADWAGLQRRAIERNEKPLSEVRRFA